MGIIGKHGGIVIMVIKAISEPCTCIHIVVVKCTLCPTENLMVTQCACIHVHVSYYGHEGTFGVACIQTIIIKCVYGSCI